MHIEKILIGGWFQRTFMHLEEIHDFLNKANPPLKFNKAKLNNLRTSLNLENFKLKKAKLDFLVLKTKTGIEVKIFEDGLIVLDSDYTSKNEEKIAQEINKVKKYYEEKLSPALSYLFKFGAPIPKELASIKTIYPYFIITNNANKNSIQKLLNNFKQKKHFEIKEKNFGIHKGDKLFIINNKQEKMDNIHSFINEQIFIREFRSQLHSYLNIHRIIWDKIDKLKNGKIVKGKDIENIKNKVATYERTINLIESRINQMSAYLKTREAIAKNNKDLKHFKKALDYKYEGLMDTLNYTKEIWNMTKNNVKQASSFLEDLYKKTSENSIKTLTVVTALGVGGTIMRMLTVKEPTFSSFGVYFFFGLIIFGYLANWLIKQFYLTKTYKIENTEIDKKIS